MRMVACPPRGREKVKECRDAADDEDCVVATCRMRKTREEGALAHAGGLYATIMVTAQSASRYWLVADHMRPCAPVTVVAGPDDTMNAAGRVEGEGAGDGRPVDGRHCGRTTTSGRGHTCHTSAPAVASTKSVKTVAPALGMLPRLMTTCGRAGGGGRGGGWTVVP
jgi:hypothetical protein